MKKNCSVVKHLLMFTIVIACFNAITTDGECLKTKTVEKTAKQKKSISDNTQTNSDNNGNDSDNNSDNNVIQNDDNINKNVKKINDTNISLNEKEDINNFPFAKNDLITNKQQTSDFNKKMIKNISGNDNIHSTVQNHNHNKFNNKYKIVKQIEFLYNTNKSYDGFEQLLKILQECNSSGKAEYNQFKDKTLPLKKDNNSVTVREILKFSHTWEQLLSFQTEIVNKFMEYKGEQDLPNNKYNFINIKDIKKVIEQYQNNFDTKIIKHHKFIKDSESFTDSKYDFPKLIKLLKNGIFTLNKQTIEFSKLCSSILSYIGNTEEKLREQSDVKEQNKISKNVDLLDSSEETYDSNENNNSSYIKLLNSSNIGKSSDNSNEQNSSSIISLVSSSDTETNKSNDKESTLSE